MYQGVPCCNVAHALKAGNGKDLQEMKDAMHSGGPAVVARQENSRRPKKRLNVRCSVCTRRTWFKAIPLMEPEGVPEPRHSWILCNGCYRALLSEMRRSPVRSPLRLRIAMGLVAAERWPKAYRSSPRSRALLSDRRWVIVIAWGFVIAMLLHLMLIVMLAYITR